MFSKTLAYSLGKLKFERIIVFTGFFICETTAKSWRVSGAQSKNKKKNPSCVYWLLHAYVDDKALIETWNHRVSRNP